MRLRYLGEVVKTLVDVATLELGKVVEVSEELGQRLLERLPEEWERIFGDEETESTPPAVPVETPSVSVRRERQQVFESPSQEVSVDPSS